MTNQEQLQVEGMKQQVRQKYPWLQSEEIDEAYEIALVDFIMYSYPSASNRPTVETLPFDFITINRIKVRMIDIISRAGGINAIAYKENGIDIKYGASYVDANWVISLGLPKAGVPQ